MARLSKKGRLLLGLGIAAVAVSILLEIVVPDPHAYDPNWVSLWYHHAPGLYALIGFVATWLIVVVSKFLGKVWLQRPEDYYERD